MNQKKTQGFANSTKTLEELCARKKVDCINDKKSALGRYSLPDYLPFSKPKVNWLFHIAFHFQKSHRCGQGRKEK